MTSSRGREFCEVLVESISELSQIQNRCGDRKAAMEMAFDPSHELHPQLRELLTKIETAKDNQWSPQYEKDPVDLQAGKQLARKDRAPVTPNQSQQETNKPMKIEIIADEPNNSHYVMVNGRAYSRHNDLEKAKQVRDNLIAEQAKPLPPAVEQLQRAKRAPRHPGRPEHYQAPEREQERGQEHAR
jgi:hypothetical protein